MSLLLSVAAVAVCIIVSESKERTASLVVLPPLVIGYDELYHDSQENPKKQTKEKEEEKKDTALVEIALRGDKGFPAEEKEVLQEKEIGPEEKEVPPDKEVRPEEKEVLQEKEVGLEEKVLQEKKVVPEETEVLEEKEVLPEEIVVEEGTQTENDRRRHDFAQRDILLDVTGRRRNYRRFMRGRNRIKLYDVENSKQTLAPEA